jgi:cell division protein FtsZ
MSAIDLGMDFQMPKNQSSQIKVMGIGGGGSNAVNYMFLNGINGVDFVVCNTDAQALEASPVPIKIQLGATLTEGLGAGSDPEIGRKAAEESEDKIIELLDANTKMLFITAGMGGGTGTGAAPVIAEIAREKGILTVGVVTNPFSTEGGFRKEYAEEGVAELKKYVDTLLIINNDKLIEVYGDLTFTQAFGKANEILNTATKGIAEVISQHLLVNIDLNDARKVLENSGTAVMGQAEAEGENRAIEAVMGALDSPLLNDNDITGAQQVLLKIVTGEGEGEIRMSELSKIKNKIQEAAGRNVNIIEGIGIDPDLGNFVSVTVIATGFEQKKKPKGPTTIVLGEDKDLEDITAEDTLTIEDTNDTAVEDTENNQQILDLEEVVVEATAEPIVEEEAEIVEPVVSAIPEKIVFDLEPEINDTNENEETAEQVITSILMEEETELEQTIELDLEEDEIIEEEAPTLNTLESTQVNTDTMKVEARERESRLRAISQQLRTPSGLTDLEDVPAYQRNNIELEEETHSSENEISTYTLSEGENNTTELKQNNSFLHDNVD